MLKKLLHILIILAVISTAAYGAEDFEFGPSMYVSDSGTAVSVPTAANAENTAFAVTDGRIWSKSKTNYQALSFDLMIEEFADASFIVSDTKNREAVLFSLDSRGSISGGSLSVGVDAGQWQSFIIAFDEGNAIYVYMNGELFCVVSPAQNMRGIYSMGFDGGTAYYDNVEFSDLKSPCVVRAKNNAPGDGLSEATLLFNTPLLIDGTVTREYTYRPSEALEHGESSYASINALDLLNNEINISYSLTGASEPRIYFINKISHSSVLVEATMKIFNPRSISVQPTVYICAFCDDTLVGINVYDNVKIEPGISNWKFSLDISGLEGEISVRLFVWEEDIKPYQKDSFAGIFETTVTIYEK